MNTIADDYNGSQKIVVLLVKYSIGSIFCDCYRETRIGDRT